MPETKVQKFHLVKVSPHFSETEALDFIESSFGNCLKKQQDHLILDLSQAREFERGYTNLLTKWIRNLKSLNGSLILTGIDDNKYSMLKTTRLTSLFDIYKTLEDFEKDHEGILIIPHDAEADPTQKKEPQKELEVRTEISEEVIEIDADANLEADADELAKIETENNLEPGSEEIAGIKSAEETEIKPRPNSITEKVDIKKLEELNSDSDVSDQLAFLNTAEDIAVEESLEANPAETDLETVVEIAPTSGFADDLEEENPKTTAAPESGKKTEELLEITEERGTESFYNIMGDSADSDLDVAENMLDDLDDVAIDEELFSEEGEENSEIPEAKEENEVEDPKPESETSEVRTTESYYNLMGDTAESGVDEKLLGSLDSVEVDEELFEEDNFHEESEDIPLEPGPESLEPGESASEEKKETLDEEEEFLDVPVGENSQIIDFSGEYQCLGCGELDYFLKGERFHECKNLSCEGKTDGWHLVCLIF